MNIDTTSIIQIMYHGFGRDLSIYNKEFFEKTVSRRLESLGILSFSDYLNYLSQSKTEVDLLWSALNINYSEFFRNSLTFAILEQSVLPKIIESKSGGGEIRIWSAGCSFGQEAYSIAILLDKLTALKENAVRYRILGSDTSLTALSVAQKGSYNASAMANVSLKCCADYFSKAGDIYTISQKIQNKVTFTAYDLLDSSSDFPPESIFGDFDLVLCCNLLFYYQAKQQKIIIDKIIRATAHGGYLVTGEAEKYLLMKSKALKEVISNANILQKKYMEVSKYEES